MIVLWLLIVRALAIELRMQVELNVWRTFFDGLFFYRACCLQSFRRCARECNSRRAAGRGWLFFSSAPRSLITIPARRVFAVPVGILLALAGITHY
jgi:hypothetical protein